MSAAVVPIPTRAMTRHLCLTTLERLGGIGGAPVMIPAFKDVEGRRIAIEIALAAVLDDAQATGEERERARHAAHCASLFCDCAVAGYGEPAPVYDLAAARARRGAA